MSNIMDKILGKNKEKKKIGNIFISGDNTSTVLDTIIKGFHIQAKKIYTDSVIVLEELKNIEADIKSRSETMEKKRCTDYSRLYEPKFIVFENLEILADQINELYFDTLIKRFDDILQLSGKVGIFYIFIVSNDICNSKFKNVAYDNCLYKIHYGKFKENTVNVYLLFNMDNEYAIDKFGDISNKLLIKYSNEMVTDINLNEFEDYLKTDV